MCVVCMKQGGGGWRNICLLPLHCPSPSLPHDLPLGAGGGGTPHCPGLWGVVGGRLSIRSETLRPSVYKPTLSLSYTPWQQLEKRVQGRPDEEEGPLLRAQED